jgi:hypothetical protein
MKASAMLRICLVFIIGIAFVHAQEDETLKETVSVINVEVPVRVFLDGKPVIDLKKEDFTIYEDGKAQAINGFQLVTKKIASGESPAGPAILASRYFVLAFRVFDFNDPLQDGLKYVFDKILLPQDQLLVLINEKTRTYQDVADKEKIRSEIEADLREQCRSARKTIQANTKEFDEWINHVEQAFKNGENWGSKPAMMRDFLQKYLDMMLIFKKRFLTQDIDQYYYFAEHLEKVRKEKWVLNFYQQEILPRLNPNKDMLAIVRTVISECEESPYGELRGFEIILTQLLQRIETEAKTGVEFPVEEVSKLFMKVNATFHTIFINAQMDADSQNLDLQQIGSGIQTNLQDLTEKTGGKLIVSSDLVSSLGTIIVTEDSYYMLTYSPDNPAKKGKIKVKTASKKHDLLYDNNLRANYISEYLRQKEKESPTVKIKGLGLIAKKLSLSLQDFSLSKVKDETCGWLKIHIIVQNSDRQVFFNQEKVLKASSQSFSLSLDFNFLPAGKYDIIVKVLDQVSGKTATEVIQPLIR